MLLGQVGVGAGVGAAGAVAEQAGFLAAPVGEGRGGSQRGSREWGLGRRW